MKAEKGLGPAVVEGPACPWPIVGLLACVLLKKDGVVDGVELAKGLIAGLSAPNDGLGVKGLCEVVGF